MKSIKRSLIRNLAPLSWLFIGVFIGIIIIVLWYCKTNTIITHKHDYDIWEISYYVSAIIGSFATFLAVIVAIFKESILRWLYSPKLEVSLVDNGITEILRNENERNPEATVHECHANIENIGSLAAIGCKINISDIKYSKNSRSGMKSIKGCKTKQLFWTAAEVDIPVNISNRIRLFEIYNPESVGTPQTEVHSIPPRIKLNGCDLPNEKSQKGYWIIEYYISCKNGDVSKFELTIEWNGEFKGRAEDMKDLLIVNITKK